MLLLTKTQKFIYQSQKILELKNKQVKKRNVLKHIDEINKKRIDKIQLNINQ